ncbi:MAG: hypothetical protein Q7W30_10470 [Coriobacteriia bacterium]|nr:hypothetical protein [Coriobacteriia bacterium]
MHMPSIPHAGRGHGHNRHRRMRPSPLFICFVLVESVFWAGCAACLLSAVHRVADGIRMQARLKALKVMPDAFTDEERLALIHKIKSRALSSY